MAVVILGLSLLQVFSMLMTSFAIVSENVSLAMLFEVVRDEVIN